ncbi:NAD-dependent epimerase/dehydratase family protein [Castellaniella caeni]
MFSGKHILLTGGTGFFGRWILTLIATLNEDGADVRVTSVSRNPCTFLGVYPEFQVCRWLAWVCADVRDLSVLAQERFDFILHAATDTSSAAHAKPIEIFETIIHGARNIYDLAVKNGGARVLVTGSGAQYGRLNQHILVFEDYMGACVSNQASSIYGESKRLQETLGSIYIKEHGLPIIMARCFAFSGPGLPLDAHFAIGNFVRDALFSDEVVLRSTGQAVRSYLYGADLAAWLLLLLARGEPGEAYNVGSDHAITIADLAILVAHRLAPHKQVRMLGEVSSAERSFYVPNIDKAKALGVDIWTSLEESIDSMGLWEREISS